MREGHGDGRKPGAEAAEGWVGGAGRRSFFSVVLVSAGGDVGQLFQGNGEVWTGVGWEHPLAAP